MNLPVNTRQDFDALADRLAGAGYQIQYDLLDEKFLIVSATGLSVGSVVLKEKNLD